MKVYIAITEGNFGDLEAYAGVYSTPEKAMAAHPGTYEACTYEFSGGRFWIKTDGRNTIVIDEQEVDSEEEEEYNDDRAVVIREVEMEV